MTASYTTPAILPVMNALIRLPPASGDTRALLLSPSSGLPLDYPRRSVVLYVLRLAAPLSPSFCSDCACACRIYLFLFCFCYSLLLRVVLWQTIGPQAPAAARLCCRRWTREHLLTPPRANGFIHFIMFRCELRSLLLSPVLVSGRFLNPK